MISKAHIAQKIQARSYGFDGYFITKSSA